jgi:hypothetical protein
LNKFGAIAAAVAGLLPAYFAFAEQVDATRDYGNKDAVHILNENPVMIEGKLDFGSLAFLEAPAIARYNEKAAPPSSRPESEAPRMPWTTPSKATRALTKGNPPSVRPRPHMSNESSLQTAMRDLSEQLDGIERKLSTLEKSTQTIIRDINIELATLEAHFAMVESERNVIGQGLVHDRHMQTQRAANLAFWNTERGVPSDKSLTVRWVLGGLQRSVNAAAKAIDALADNGAQMTPEGGSLSFEVVNLPGP